MTRLPPLPTIQEIIRLYGLSARKKLSQNFLLDLNLTRKIVKSAGKLENVTIIEVGPGPGGITRSILQAGAHRVIVIEKDKRFLPTLQDLSDVSGNRMNIISGDILNFNMKPYISEDLKRAWHDSPPDIHIIGNLPFSVSTPLIIQWLENISTQSNVWALGRTSLTLTFQKEVAERMVAPPRSEYRCRLSVMCQYLCDVKLKFTIPGKAFVPAPKVDVGVVKFVPKKEPLIQQPFPLVEKICRQLFNMPNKYCTKCISTLFPPDREDLFCEIMERSEVNPQRRPFELTIAEIKSLCDAYALICENDSGIGNYDYRSKTNAKIRRRGNRLVMTSLEQKILAESDTLNDIASETDNKDFLPAR